MMDIFSYCAMSPEVRSDDTLRSYAPVLSDGRGRHVRLALLVEVCQEVEVVRLKLQNSTSTLVMHK